MVTDTKPSQSMAYVEMIKRWSPVWIIPIVTALIGAWILFYHFSHQGPPVTSSIRVGTVADVIFYTTGLNQQIDNDFRIPVLVRIEPGRFRDDSASAINFAEFLQKARQRGLRAAQKALSSLLYDYLHSSDEGPAKISKHQAELIKQPFFLELKQNEDGYDALIRTLVQGWQQEAQTIARKLQQMK